MAKRHGYTSGGGKTPEYKIWMGMLSRCYNPNRKCYKDYGGSGIEVCRSWRLSFPIFLADMGERPTPLHTLDRFPNKGGDYEPDNCRWATQKQQQRNRKNNRVLTIDGVSDCMAAWAEKYGISSKTIWNRLKLGWGDKDAVTKPLRKRAYVN